MHSANRRMGRAAAALLVMCVLLMVSLGASRSEPAEDADVPVNLTKYYVALKVKGPNRNQSEAEAAAIQAAHQRHIKEQNLAGRYVLSGPFTDDGYIRGMSIVAAANEEEARRIVEQDPAVKAGRLKVELHPALFPKLKSMAQYREGPADK